MTSEFWEKGFDGTNASANTIADDDQLTAEKLMEAWEKIQQFKLPQVEVWLSELIPIDSVIEFDLNKPNEINPPWPAFTFQWPFSGYLKGTEKIFFVHPDVYKNRRIEFANIPVFKAGGERVQ